MIVSSGFSIRGKQIKYCGKWGDSYDPGKYLYPIVFGFAMMTLGYGLFIDLDAESSLAKIVLYQIVAGLGVGPLFQAPLIALQSLVPKGDIAAATAVSPLAVPKGRPRSDPCLWTW